MKVVLNKCHGGFSVSEEVYKELGIPYDGYGYIDLERNDPKLISAIEKIGLRESDGKYARLSIVEIPDGIEWGIDNYDGVETLHEKHRSW